MSVRYGVSLIPDPVFTSRVYRVRQLVCGQYGTWAAEMHMVHLSLADYFQCSDDALDVVASGLQRIAGECCHRCTRFPLLSHGVSKFANAAGNIHLDFTVSENPTHRHQRELSTLHSEVIRLLEDTKDVHPDLRWAGVNFVPHITLMQQADLPPSVFSSAVEYTKALLRDLQVPHATNAWQMVLVRFESNAASDDWDDGSWASDLRWRVVNAYPL